MIDSLVVVGGESAAGIAGHQLWTMTAARASSRRAMRLTRPLRVRPPWRSSESWSLSVSKVDSIHWRMPPRLPKRGCSSLRSGRQQPAAERGDELLELGAGEALVRDDRLAGLEHARAQF